MSWVWLLLLGALAALGILELLHLLMLLPGRRSASGKEIRIIPVYGRMEELECVVRTVSAQKKWLLESKALILLVDLGMEAESRQIAEYLAQELDGVWLCAPEQISVVLREHFGTTPHRERSESGQEQGKGT